MENQVERTNYKVGYLGTGEYKSRENGKKTREYETWRKMLTRCYSDIYKKSRSTYNECSVCDEWLNFQNFAEWYGKNYYEIPGQRTELDKDILQKHNKVYSPTRCVFVPQRINALFISRKNDRGPYAIGVIKVTNRKNLFMARCSDGTGTQKTVGYFKTELETFIAYKEFKERIIRKTAEEFRDRIPEKLYNALMKYEVDIND